MQTIKLNKDILKLVHNFIQINSMNFDQKYNVNDKVSFFGNRLYYERNSFLFSFIYCRNDANSMTFLNSQVYKGTDGSNYTELQLYDLEKSVLIDNDKIIQIPLTEFEQYSSEDIFALSTIGDYTDLILNSMLHLMYFKKEYNFLCLDINYYNLLKVTKEYPELVQKPWNIKRYEK